MRFDSLLLLNLGDDRVLTIAVARADSFTRRMRGLLGHPAPPKGCALLIERCGSVHTVGMKYPLDLVFLDRQNRVTRVCPNVPPNRLFVFGGRRAASVLETSCGWLPLSRLRPGMVATVMASSHG